MSKQRLKRIEALEARRPRVFASFDYLACANAIQRPLDCHAAVEAGKACDIPVCGRHRRQSAKPCAGSISWLQGSLISRSAAGRCENMGCYPIAHHGPAIEACAPFNARLDAHLRRCRKPLVRWDAARTAKRYRCDPRRLSRLLIIL
jgi:hypothetical protein